jgi:hypothetical protein
MSDRKNHRRRNPTHKAMNDRYRDVEVGMKKRNKKRDKDRRNSWRREWE